MKKEDPPKEVIPEEPPVPQGPFPSELYPSLDMNTYYKGELEGFVPTNPEEERIAKMFWPMSILQNKLKDYDQDKLWTYYTIDVQEQLGKDLRITD